MNTRQKQTNCQSGQVLITGVIMLIALLLMLLSIFDVHNIIRAKFKFETAQQAAALAGAKWQKESLNLIGELNILKACITLLEGEKNWDIPLPPNDEELLEARKMAVQGRIDQLTEMQTRISFIGPMIGYGAAQQAAKANGMRNIKNGGSQGDLALSSYINRLLMRKASGRTRPINNYDWFDPYLSMVVRIAASGVAVLPNARGTGRPSVSPSELGNTSFYEALLKHKGEIALIAKNNKRKVGDQSSWLGITKRFIRDYAAWTDYVLGDTRYWEIDYNLSAFPNESEIFTLGVQTGFSAERTWEYEPTFHSSADNYSENPKYPAGALPGDMKWFCYDDTWYPDYYDQRFADYKHEHFDYWFGGTVLRSKVKQKYLYEGTAAYAETASLEIDRALRFKPNKKYSKSNSGLIRKRNTPTTAVGPRRNVQDYENDSFSTSYRPGAIAKVLGELPGERAPITLPVILPVFDQAVIMPTYMPIPAGFEVLRNFKSPLDSFLAWLSDEEVKTVFNYKNAPPASTAEFLEALQVLSKGKEFRYFGYNPEAPKNAQQLFEENKNFLFNWEKDYEKFTYSLSNPDGLGWLQEPRRCYEIQKSVKPGTTLETPDNINGGTATRYYVSSFVYYVVDSRGKVITNEDSDPTIRYTSYAPGKCNCQGPCTCSTLIPSSHNSQKGPPRI